MKKATHTILRPRWITLAVLLGVATVALAVLPLGTWEQPQLLFSMVVVSSAACIAAATIVIAMADRRRVAEMGLLGTMLLVASIMPLVHGLLVPDVLFDTSAGFRLASFLTIPVALLACAPLLVPRSAFGRWAARHWRDWTLLAVLGAFVIASVVVFFPDAVSVPSASSPATILVSAVGVLAVAALSARQMRMFELGRRTENFVASVALALVSLMAVTPLFTEPYTAGFWWTHVAGATGVFGACASLAISRRLSPSAHDLLAPILSRDPLAAFELGLSPVVHDFVAEIDAKDAITRDHVVRTAELAMRVGERFRLSATELRNIGLAAMLHDVGKVNVPDEILQKPARLTDAEYEVMKLHPVDGEQMLAAEPTLADAAVIVRSHHERVDGGGYPDGLVGREIPLGSRIIAACDALDAMTHDRQYRDAMPVGLAFAILREHAGAQWDANVVDAVIAVAPTIPSVAWFDDVGRRTEDVASAIAIPDDIGELLTTVDAEI